MVRAVDLMTADLMTGAVFSRRAFVLKWRGDGNGGSSRATPGGTPSVPQHAIRMGGFGFNTDWGNNAERRRPGWG